MTEKTEFEIALRDSISPGLKAVARQLKELNASVVASSTPSAASTDHLTRQTTLLGSAARNTLRDLEGVGSFLVGAGKGILGVGGSIATVKALASSISNLALSRVQMTMFSKDTRLAADDVQKLRDALSAMGMAATNADSVISNLSGKLQEMQAFKQDSQLWKDLSRMGEGGVRLANELMNEKDVMKSIRRILEVYRTQGTQAQIALERMLGVPASVLQNLEQELGKVRDRPQVSEKIAQDFLDNQIKLSNRLNTEWVLFATHAMEEINKFFDEIDEETWGKTPIADFLISEFDHVTTKIKATKEELEAIDKFAKDLSERLGKPTDVRDRLRESLNPFFPKQSWEDKPLQQLKTDQNKLLRSIDDALKNLFGGGGEPGAGVGTGAGGESGGGGGGDDTGPPAVRSRGARGGERTGADDTTKGDTTTGDASVVPTSPEVRDKTGVAGFIVHHTGGRGDPRSVVEDWRAHRPGVGTRYITDRQGNIHDVWSEYNYHPQGMGGGILPGWGRGVGLSNRNVVGMEVVARNDRDVTDAQVEAVRKFLREKFADVPVYGHGEVNPGHREADEGMRIVGAVRAERQSQRATMDSASDSVWKKGTSSIKFNFNNVPEGVKTNVQAGGSFTNVEVSRKSAIEERAPD